MALNLRNPNGYDGQPATHTKQGIVRLATDAEITAGTADNVAVTPAQLSSSVPVPLTVPLGGTGLTTITDHAVMVGSGAGAVTPVATSATAGVPLVSAGAAADPAFGTAVVAGGGTGVTSATAYAVLTGGTTATGAFQSIASVGAAGEVLTSNGAGALPTFQAVPAADFSSPPPLGDIAPNEVYATLLNADGSGVVSLESSGNMGLTANGDVNLRATGGNIVYLTGAISLPVTTTITSTSGTDLTFDLDANAVFQFVGNSVTLNGGGDVIATGTVQGATLSTNGGNVVRAVAGDKDAYTSVATTTTAGANSAGTVTLAGGTATVNTTAVTASSLIRLYRQDIGSTGAAALGHITRGTITPSTSFVINSVQAADATALQASDVSVVFWEIVN